MTIIVVSMTGKRQTVGGQQVVGRQPWCWGSSQELSSALTHKHTVESARELTESDMGFGTSKPALIDTCKGQSEPVNPTCPRTR